MVVIDGEARLIVCTVSVGGFVVRAVIVPYTGDDTRMMRENRESINRQEAKMLQDGRDVGRMMKPGCVDVINDL